MIDPAYVQMMARYNAWQNMQVTDLLREAPAKVLTKDHKAFWGSILGTLNHLLWGDQIWMSRFTSDVTPPTVPADQNTEMTPTFAVWTSERFRMDGRIRMWADTLRAIDLKGPFRWTSGMKGQEHVLPMGQCVTAFFNHQTHHRGQVHGMMTASGLKAPVTDLCFMPGDL